MFAQHMATVAVVVARAFHPPIPAARSVELKLQALQDIEVFEAGTSSDKVSPDRQADRPQIRQGFFEGKVLPHSPLLVPSSSVSKKAIIQARTAFNAKVSNDCSQGKTARKNGHTYLPNTRALYWRVHVKEHWYRRVYVAEQTNLPTVMTVFFSCPPADGEK